MYGIIGIFLKDGHLDRKQLYEATQKLQHRGPDQTGSFFDTSLGLAHTRLSIIDLLGGNQPLFARNGQLVLIFIVDKGKRPPERMDPVEMISQ